MVASLLLILLPLVWNSFDKLQFASAQFDIPELNAVVSYPTCDDCYCIKENNETCPAENPAIGYSAVDRKGGYKFAAGEFSEKEIITPIILGCNPFRNKLCDTQPPRQFRYDLDPVGHAKAVCGIFYNIPRRGCPDEYELVSYPSWEAAEDAGAVVTHTGPCGVCSTTKDLGVMMTTRDFGDILAQCLLQFGVFGFNIKNIIECAQEVDLSPDCLKMLIWGSRQTTEDCADVCSENADLENLDLQGSPPECKLNSCAQCTIDKQDFITSYLGRNNYNSGILAGYVQPCSSYVNLTHNSCPNATELEIKQNISSVDPLVADKSSGNVSNGELHHFLSLVSISSLTMTVLLHWNLFW